MKTLPVLYSYRRCPYAMRARMAIFAAGLLVEQREIVFWDKPFAMLQASPKGTVPVLVLAQGQVIDESRDIMLWALQQSDPLGWLADGKADDVSLVNSCDLAFKDVLDRYKYAERFPEFSAAHYRQQGESFLQALEIRLQHNEAHHAVLALHPLGIGLLDGAIFPFVRQFAQVDVAWFTASPYDCLQRWLAQNMASEVFCAVMQKRPVWAEGDTPLLVGRFD